MPEQIRCPSCDAALRVPEQLLGSAVKCPKCETTFTAELPPPQSVRRDLPPPEESPPIRIRDDEDDFGGEEEDRPRRRRRRRRDEYANAEAQVSGLAIALMVVSGLSIVGALVDLVFRVINLVLGTSGPLGQKSMAPDFAIGTVVGGGFDLFSTFLAVLILVGAIKMKKLQAHGLALTACVLAIIPIHCCCILGIPFGIWGLVVLNKPEVKDAFS